MLNNSKCYILTILFSLVIGLGQTLYAQNSTEKNKSQTGEASWYGSRYHGRATSSGEPYNKHDMTAAHKTLPFGTKVKVTNLDNNETVIVRINDRGPFVGDRIIDLSEAAARELKFHAQGIGNVKIEVLQPGAELATAAGFSFDVTSFTDYAFASDDAVELAISRN